VQALSEFARVTSQDGAVIRPRPPWIRCRRR